jgi:hypothetical protein
MSRRTMGVAAALILLCSSAGGCDRANRKVKPESFKKLSKILPGKPLTLEDLSGGCLASFVGRCEVEIRKSDDMIRRGKLKFGAGLKIAVDFRPVEGSRFQVSLDPTNNEVELAVRKSGGVVSLDCIAIAGGACAVVLEKPG